MEHLFKGLFGEKSLTKVVGLYRNAADAAVAADKAQRLPGMTASQIRILGPKDARNSRRELFGRSLEPEQQGILKTILRAHLVTGIVGAALGLLLYAWLLKSGQPMVVSTPWLAFLAIVGFSTTFGLLLGGLISLRPDHVKLITDVRSALSDNQWALILHPTNAEQATAARDLLAASGAEVLNTL